MTQHQSQLNSTAFSAQVEDVPTHDLAEVRALLRAVKEPASIEIVKYLAEDVTKGLPCDILRLF